MTHAPRVAKPHILAEMSVEDRERVVEEVRFAEFSSSLENQTVQSLAKIRRATEATAKSIGALGDNIEVLRQALQASARASELLLLHNLGFDVSHVPEVDYLASRYGVKPQVVVTRVASTEPGCSHPQCILEHPHAGPAVLSKEVPE